MKSEVRLMADVGESVTEILVVQTGGRVSIVDALRALDIKEKDWKGTCLQAHLMLLPGKE